MGFPKHVYKRGTGVAVNADGLFTAECELVSSEEDLSKLPGSWCDSPVEAAATKGGPQKEAAPTEAPKEDKPAAKKVK